MTACTSVIRDGTLVCTGTAGHAGGHRFESTSAGDDRHEDGGHG